MPVSSFDLILWAAGFLNLAILLGILLFRKRIQQFPVFTALISFSLIRSCVLFVVLTKYPNLYFAFYWSLAALDALLGFAILYESASLVFRPTGVWAQDVKATLWALLFVSIAVGLSITLAAAPVTRHPAQTYILRGKFLSATLMTELCVGMMALSVHAGLAWKTHVARICQGLGFYSAVCVVSDAVLNLRGIHGGSVLYKNFSHFRILVYNGCLIFWTASLLRKAPQAREMPEAVHKQLLLLQMRLGADLDRLRGRK